MPYMNANFIKVESQPMNMSLNLMQQQQQLQDAKLSCQASLEGQILDNGAWDVYQQNNIAAAFQQQQANAMVMDTRRLSAAPAISQPHPVHAPKLSNGRKSPKIFVRLNMARGSD